jgi:hypothetical protein
MHHDLARAVLCLPGFIDFDAGGWRHRVTVGLLADHPATNQPPRNKPGIRGATGTRLCARCLRGIRAAYGT